MAKIDACEFSTYEEMGKKVAEKALDEFLYNGKTIREWMQIIASEDAISRQEALASIKALYPNMPPVIDIFGARRKWLEKYAPYFECENAIEQLQPIKQETETVTEFADRCRECGAKYGKLFDQKTGHWNIPFLIHKELEIPIYEAQKAYEVAIDYLRNQAYVRG